MGDWVEEWVRERDEAREREENKIQYVKCLKCGQSCRVWVVRKEGKNQGRQFISCKCGRFKWLSKRVATNGNTNGDGRFAYSERAVRKCPNENGP
jgi:formate dehydrogenase maturation protein FdhE